MSDGKTLGDQTTDDLKQGVATRDDGGKSERASLIPIGFIRGLRQHAVIGARKYTDHNWAKSGGMQYSRVYDSLCRHLDAFWDPDESDYDEETGSHHLIAAAWNCMALWFYSVQDAKKRKDDRTAIEDNFNKET